MNLNTFKSILDVLEQVGITETVLEPAKGGGTLIRGASSEQSIIIFDTVDEAITDIPIGVQTVKGLNSRLRLFDVEKASIELKPSNGDEYAVELTIKQGRRKASFRAAPPKKLNVPHTTLESGECEFVELIPATVDYLSSAIASMRHTGKKGERTISMSVTDGDLGINIFDGEDDCFDDIIPDVGVDELPKGLWEVDPFQKVMKQSGAMDEEDVARMTIDGYRVARFKVGPIEVMVCPTV